MKRVIAGSASMRSTVCGLGLSERSRTRAAPGVSSEMSRPTSESGTIATPRPSVSARAIRSSAVRRRDVPGGGRGPAVVDQQRERRARLRGRERRIPQRAGGRDDQQRGEREAQQREPPRRARGRLFLRQRCRTGAVSRAEFLAARARRHQPQQPPQHRQADQPEQHQRLRESRAASRRSCGAPVGVARASGSCRCRASPAPMRLCSASSSSLAGRSVRWMMKLQPSRSVSARISARWRSMRA